jgi:hypothetical protein
MKDEINPLGRLLRFCRLWRPRNDGQCGLTNGGEEREVLVRFLGLLLLAGFTRTWRGRRIELGHGVRASKKMIVVKPGRLLQQAANFIGFHETRLPPPGRAGFKTWCP